MIKSLLPEDATIYHEGFSTKVGTFSHCIRSGILCVGIYLARGVDGADIASWSKPALIPGLGLLLLALRRGKKLFLWLSTAFLFFLLGFHIATNQLWRGRDYAPSAAKHVVHATV